MSYTVFLHCYHLFIKQKVKLVLIIHMFVYYAYVELLQVQIAGQSCNI